MPFRNNNTTAMMTTRQRFHETMSYGKPDRVPYLEEGIRQDVLRAWYKQGLKRRTKISDLFTTDRFVEIDPDLDPFPEPTMWPETCPELEDFKQRLDPDDQRRWPDGWKKFIRESKKSDQLVFLRVHRGLFLSLGTGDWRRFERVMTLAAENQSFVEHYMHIQSRFACLLMEKILKDLTVDAAIFSEPIGGNEGPLISPQMYESLVLSSYQPLIRLLQQNGIRTIIFRTYANVRIYIPSILKFGINSLWACETNAEVMDYRQIRKEYGRDLRLIGGIDLDVLRAGKEAIKREIMEKVPLLIAEGGYVPLADGRVRSDIRFDNYYFYRKLLEDVTRPE
jgi:hypothetical protein